MGVEKTIWNKFHEQARQNPKVIVFPEGEEVRVQKAVQEISKKKVAQCVLLGEESKIPKLGFPVVNPKTSSLKKDFLSILWERLKVKGLSEQQVDRLVEDPLYFGCLYVRQGLADGFLGGAVRTTADTVRAAFHCLGMAPKASIVFGAFLVEAPYAEGALKSKIFVFADCAVIPTPSPRQLAKVALGACEVYQFFLGDQQMPRVAFLSFSTAGSAQHETVDRVREAVTLAKQSAIPAGGEARRGWRNPKFAACEFEGELQADAALIPWIARQKGAQGPVAGEADILIFPNLEAGNISYKLVQRLGSCKTVGPVLWGLSKPANDLSRGCEVQDIVDECALTAFQAQRW